MPGVSRCSQLKEGFNTVKRLIVKGEYIGEPNIQACHQSIDLDHSKQLQLCSLQYYQYTSYELTSSNLNSLCGKFSYV
jgi:hypothetical protein